MKRRIDFTVRQNGLVLLFAIAIWILMVPFVQGQSISYIYPSGGKQGTRVEVLIAGMGGLSQASDVFVDGEGVTAKILYRSTSGDFLFNTPFGSKSREIINDILKDETKLLGSGVKGRINDARDFLNAKRRKKYDDRPVKENEIPMPKDEEVFKAYPYVNRLAEPTFGDLQLIYYEYFAFNFDKRVNNQSRDVLTVEFHITPDAKPGVREVRVLTPRGLSRSGRFWVSTVREVVEVEPNDGIIWDGWKRMTQTQVRLPVQSIPVIFNGQIRPGDIDRFYFRARKFQRLTLDVQARSLEPFIANAVPGWFAAVISLYDPDGQKIRVCESYRFDQNPLMLVKTQKTGVYCVEIQDSIFRGRNDFVYRIAVGSFPLVHSFFPLGGAAGKPLEISLAGGNLSKDKISVDTGGNVYYEDFRTVSLLGEKEPLIRPFRYVVETLPVFYEPERPDAVEPRVPRSYTKEDCRFSWLPFKSKGDEEESPSTSEASPEPLPTKVSPVSVSFPCVVYGKISRPYEVDIYQFQGRPGQKIVLDLAAQRLGGALDAVLELVDPSGNVVADSDDRSDASGPNIGTATHDADPYIESEIMMDGVYSVRVFGRLRRSGTDCFYRLRISPPQGDFRVVTVGSIARVNGLNASFKVRVFRSEGFDGPIRLRVAGNGEQAVLAGGGQIPVGETAKTFGVRLAKKLDPNPSALELEAVATINGKEIVRPVLAADDWEQAFIYHHLVPSSHLYLAHGGKVPPEVAKANELKKKEAERRKKLALEKQAATAEGDKTTPGTSSSKTNTSKSDGTKASNAKKDSKFDSRKEYQRDRRGENRKNEKSAKNTRYKSNADSKKENSRSSRPGNNRSNRQRR